MKYIFILIFVGVMSMVILVNVNINQTIISLIDQFQIGNIRSEKPEIFSFAPSRNLSKEEILMESRDAINQIKSVNVKMDTKQIIPDSDNPNKLRILQNINDSLYIYEPDSAYYSKLGFLEYSFEEQQMQILDSNEMWLKTTDSGVYLYDFTNEKWTKYSGEGNVDDFLYGDDETIETVMIQFMKYIDFEKKANYYVFTFHSNEKDNKITKQLLKDYSTTFLEADEIENINQVDLKLILNQDTYLPANMELKFNIDARIGVSINNIFEKVDIQFTDFNSIKNIPFPHDTMQNNNGTSI